MENQNFKHADIFANHTLKINCVHNEVISLSFTNNGSFTHAIHVNAWKDCICVSGDYGCFTFRRPDTNMVYFWNANKYPDGTASSYIQEKMIGTCKRYGHTEFSLEEMHKSLKEIVDDFYDCKIEEEENNKASQSEIENIYEERENCWEQILEETKGISTEQEEFEFISDFEYEDFSFSTDDFNSSSYIDSKMYEIACVGMSIAIQEHLKNK